MKNSEHTDKQTARSETALHTKGYSKEVLIDLQNATYDFIIDHNHDMSAYNNFSNDVRSFVKTVVSSINFIIEKDKNWPPCLLECELKEISELLIRYPHPHALDQLFDQISSMIKEKLVYYFPDSYELSPNGFRLLDRHIAHATNTLLVILMFRHTNKTT